jgi:iron complex transport system ATP-binding protein
MAIAQDTPLLLDEPTTYLDIAHQYELLALCRTLNRTRGRTLVMVLQDLNQAARYADYIIAMKDGGIVAGGAPRSVITEALIEAVFGMRAMIVPDPVTATPRVISIATGAPAGTDAAR